MNVTRLVEEDGVNEETVLATRLHRGEPTSLYAVSRIDRARCMSVSRLKTG
jgi:hypothetical protein